MLTKDFFINNRKNLCNKLPNNSVVVIASNGLLQKTADNNYPFTQDSNFYYLTGLSTPNAFIILDVANKKEFFCYSKKSKIEILFDGDYDYQLIAKTSGIENFIETKKAFEWLKSNAKTKKIYFNINKKQSYLYNNPHNALVHKKLKLRNFKIINVSQQLNELRCIKQKAEIKLIELGVKHTKNAIDLATKNLASKKSESQIASIINNYFVDNGLMHAYEPMVAAGKSSTTAHYSDNNKLFSCNDFLLIDVGAEIYHYCSDISRTFVKSNSNKYEFLIAELINIQKQIIDSIKPGILFKDLQLRATELIGELLLKNSFINNKKQTSQYFPYAIGHFLGLDVHDVGDYAKPLEPNMIITIEPGIHIPNHNIGIRIEDDILITKSGARVL